MPQAIYFLKQAWPIFVKNFWRFIVFWLALLLIMIVLVAIFGTAVIAIPSPVVSTIIGVVVAIVAAGWLIGAFQVLVINASDNKDTALKSVLKTGWQSALTVAAAMVVLLLGYVVGFVLLVIPGLILLTLTIFTIIEAVRRKTTAFEAIRGSVQQALKASWLVAQLFFLGSVVGALLVLLPGFLAFFGWLVSLFVVQPVFFIAEYLQYKKITSLTKKQAAPPVVILSVVVLVLVWLALSLSEPGLPGGLQPEDLPKIENFEQIFDKFLGGSIREN